MKLRLSSLGWLVLVLPFLCVGLAHATLLSSFADETRNVSGFHAVANSGSIVVEVRLDNRESVRLEGDEAAIRQIETVVEGGTLKIRFKDQSGRTNWGKVTAHVSAKQLDGLTQSGSGSISVSGVISGGELNVALSGAGRIRLEAGTELLKAVVGGSGRIRAAGLAVRCNASSSGWGRFDGRDLETHAASVKVSVAGGVDSHIGDQLDASISGSGK